MTEFTNAVNSKTKDTSPGFDNVTYSILRYLPQSALKTILILFNNIWNYETVIPFSWKHIKIIAIVKPSKNNHEETSYRPIPLITCIQQIFNTIIKNRMEWICDKIEVIPDTQYGFRKGRGYNDYLLNFIIDVYIPSFNLHRIYNGRIIEFIQ